ncbi:hypothetical protein HWV62_21872 [Athelia sp. TMB]|nr:hypothetical protein HWV62_21872 [Athelia sp. TMB]
MMLSSLLTTFLLGASLSTAAPLLHRPRDVTIVPADVAQSQVRDNTATRAFTNATITDASGQCLTIDPLAGDFRENLIPVTAAACNGSAGQQWDVITAGVHNNVPGAALIVSSDTQGCLNFDPRRAAGDQVILFSCGGRADGGGSVTNSQLFNFATGESSVALVPQNAANATCLIVSDGALGPVDCDNSADQLFTIGGGLAASPSTPATSDPLTSAPITSSAAASNLAAGTSSASLTPAPSATTTPTTTTASVTSVSGAGGVLNPSAVAESNPRDNTATRAFSSAAITTADGECLTINPLAGDFRENLIPVTATACDGSAGQQWDVITAGVHNNVPGAALFVSSETQGCLNFDPRRAVGNQVILFSCGGRADGGGSVTNSQLFNFAAGSTSLPLVPQNGANATCLIVTNGSLGPIDCDNSADQLFFIGEGSSGSAAPSSTLVASTAPSSVSVSSATTSSAAASNLAVGTTPASLTPATSTTATATATTPSVISVSGAGGMLNPTAAAEANPRDNTATRAFSSAAIKDAAGQCLTINPNAGDFRENLIPVTAAACDGSAGQQWDVITAGVHNNVPGAALFVSSMTQGCLNFDPRRAAGNQVILFSCGGRADGGGSVTNSQLFNFAAGSSSVALVPQNAGNATCLTVGDGLLGPVDCDNSADQLFTISA